MKQIILTIITLFFYTSLQAQTVNIPDANFKNTLVNTLCVDTDGDGEEDSDADLNNDGEIQVTEAEAVINLDVSYNEISSLTGIEAFINLQVLKCSRNLLTTLDVSGLINLNTLWCHYNQIATLNVNGLTNLDTLWCQHNQLTTLDVSTLINLNTLYCSSNQLTTIDVSPLTNLNYLGCGLNQLTTLDVSSLINLNSLSCGNNQLTTLDVSPLVNLTSLNCDHNQLTTLDVSTLINLITLGCQNNQLMTLDVSGLANLMLLHCTENQLTTLNVAGATSITTLWCNVNQITALNLNGLAVLEQLFCTSNQLTDLDLSEVVNIRELMCHTNLLTTLNLKNGNGYLGNYINFSNNPDLEYICVDNVELATILAKVEESGYTDAVVNSYCSFVPGGEFYTIQGENKYDIDANGCDINDIVLPNLKYNITNGSVTGIIMSNTTGNYSIPVQEGIHTITPILETPTYFTVTPSSLVVNFPTDTSPYNQDFCVAPNGSYNDLEIILIPRSQLRQGFDADYSLIYKNNGTTTLSGIIDFNFNTPFFSLVSSIPNIDSETTGTLSWNYTNLMPFESREILFSIHFNGPVTEVPPIDAGEFFNFTVNIDPITGDETEYNNTFVLEQVVVDSFDPNDKTCLEGKTITQEQVGKFVHYMIRFENTGTADAVNIVVKDEIDMTKYDVSTLIPLSGSHEYVTRIKDNDIVEFIFEGINLPFDDANNDGYVVFKIKTLSSLTLGDTFSNDAEIYFDYNAPIITNDELTTVAENLSIEESVLQNAVSLFPNPVSDYLNVNNKNPIKQISIYDVQGRQLKTIALTGNTTATKVDLSTLSKGVYFVNIKTELGEQTSRIIKE